MSMAPIDSRRPRQGCKKKTGGEVDQVMVVIGSLAYLEFLTLDSMQQQPRSPLGGSMAVFLVQGSAAHQSR